MIFPTIRKGFPNNLPTTQDIQFEKSISAVELDVFLPLLMNVIFFAAGVFLYIQSGIR